MRILFWNTRRLNNAVLIATLAREHEADVLILAEPGTGLSQLLVELNTGEQRQYFPDASPGLSDRFQIFYRYNLSAVQIVQDGPNVAARNLSPPIHTSVLVIAVHLPSKLYMKPDDQLMLASLFAKTVNESENSVRHNRTVLVGDLNMNPFEPGVIGAGGLHAVMDRTVALRIARMLQGRSYRFFYNPMWIMLGDRDGEPRGTYYYDSGSYINYYWNIFDQIMVRPELLEMLIPERDVRILSHINGTSLVRKSDGRPDSRISDHLPVLLNLELAEVV
jgi:hypothetical protein